VLHPHTLILLYLAGFYSLTAILSWLLVRTISRSLEALAIAYANVYALEQQKDEFLQIVSHELRTPLSPLALASYLLEQRLQEQEISHGEIVASVREIGLHVKRMDRMVDVLLDIQRIDHGRFLLEVGRCDIAEILQDVVDIHRFLSHRLIITAGLETPLEIEGDARRLWQVFSNIIRNAVKYTPVETPIEVTLHVRQSAEDLPTWVEVIIHDHGPGIAAGDLPALFERNHRVVRSAEQSNEGWGLGLFICRAIMTAHHGTIDASSEQGNGTTFTVSLPLLKEEPRA
jgi:signal transduction histidine kinase